MYYNDDIPIYSIEWDNGLLKSYKIRNYNTITWDENEITNPTNIDIELLESQCWELFRKYNNQV